MLNDKHHNGSIPDNSRYTQYTLDLIFSLQIHRFPVVHNIKALYDLVVTPGDYLSNSKMLAF